MLRQSARQAATGSAKRPGWRAILAMAAGTLAAWAIIPHPPASGRDNPARRGVVPIAASGPAYVGTASCASSTCHGAGGPRGLAGSEYNTWAAADPHSHAHSVLFEARSRLIDQRYRGRTDADATTDTLCLSCHVHPDFRDARHREDFAIEDGVGCESCHGAAESYLGPHTEGWWPALDPAQKAAYGMVPTENLAGRAAACMRCHVGEPGVEVNHDLIAAGHPRLNFEYAAYLAIYPKHWSPTADKIRQPDAEARTWVIGQVAGAKASLELLAARARTAAATAGDAHPAPWPEFSEYGCFACHHDLGGPRRTFGRPAGTPPGSLPFGTWYTTLTGIVAPDPADQEAFGADLKSLASQMDRPAADPARVAEMADKIAQRLDNWLGTSQNRLFDVSETRDLIAAVAQAGTTADGSRNWDRDAQLYLALAALHNNLSDLAPAGPAADPALRDDLRKMNGLLQFPRPFDSPRDYDPAAFDALLKSLQDRLR